MGLHIVHNYKVGVLFSSHVTSKPGFRSWLALAHCAYLLHRPTHYVWCMWPCNGSYKICIYTCILCVCVLVCMYMRLYACMVLMCMCVFYCSCACMKACTTCVIVCELCIYGLVCVCCACNTRQLHPYFSMFYVRSCMHVIMCVCVHVCFCVCGACMHACVFM